LGAKMGKKIWINLSKLYWLTDNVNKSSAELLREIVEYYNLKYDVIYAESPDLEQVIVLKRDSDVIGYEDVDTKKLRKECRGTLVELFDGYETAFTCINP
jgi:hypothetical protein